MVSRRIAGHPRSYYVAVGSVKRSMAFEAIKTHLTEQLGQEKFDAISEKCHMAYKTLKDQYEAERKKVEQETVDAEKESDTESESSESSLESSMSSGNEHQKLYREWYRETVIHFSSDKVFARHLLEMTDKLKTKHLEEMYREAVMQYSSDKFFARHLLRLMDEVKKTR